MPCFFFTDNGTIKISRKLLSNWVVKTGLALKPLYNEMLKKVLGRKNLFIDESPVKVFATGKYKQGYMWALPQGHESDPPYRIYDFRENRCHNNVLEILKDYLAELYLVNITPIINYQSARLLPGFQA